MADNETFDSRAVYLQALDKVLSSARKELCIFDPDGRKLELDGRARAEGIAAFLAGGRDRSLRLILHDLDYLSRYSPRLMGLLKRYDHAFTVRQTPESLRNLTDAFVLADRINGVIRFHADYFRGKLILDDPVDVHNWHQRFEELWTESMPSNLATVLGL
jgi:hypothetical protein